ncbi:DUF4435 domain-containing protein [Polaromonas sp. YR568]|uniref:DUF4435 domain-containing protein n=1 Tax=Polaromonas sp. YR568 TaxID=1855301 RepID=UPI003137ED2A
MTRLVHSPQGFVRALEISRCNFFAFVEGGLDRAFYDRLFFRMFGGGAINYRIIAAKELPGATGGKTALLTFFQTLRRSGKLASEAFGKKSVNAFFADKDIDDVLRTQLRSKHLIYTDTYDLEGSLFKNGDLHRAVADACGMSLQQAALLIGNQQVWVEGCVKNWREWTVLCMVSHVKSVNSGCTFERSSAINERATAPTNLAAFTEAREKLRLTLGMSLPAFDALFSVYEKKLMTSIVSGTPLRFFKGKWLKTILESFLRQKEEVADANMNGSSERVASTLVAQVGVSNECAYFKKLSPPLFELARLAS